MFFLSGRGKGKESDFIRPLLCGIDRPAEMWSPAGVRFSRLLLRFGVVGSVVVSWPVLAQRPLLSAADSTPTVVRPVFEPGNTYRFVSRVELRTRLDSGVMGEAMIEQQSRFDAGVRVDGKKGIVLKGRTERLEVRLQSGGRVLTYHSLKPEDQQTPMGRHFQTALYRSVEFTLNERLRVVSSVEGGREAQESPLEGIPRFGPDELKQLISTLPQGFTTVAVQPGDVWVLEGRRPVVGAGNLNFEVTYRHRGRVSFEDYFCINIDVNGQLSGNLPHPAPGGEAGMEVQGGSIDGRLLFDPLDRMVRYSEQSINLQLVIPGTEGAAPQQVPVQQIATVRLLHIVPTR